MSETVLRLWDQTTGALTFDSTLAAGGVCLGFYTVPVGGGEKTFPTLTGVAGIAFAIAGVGAAYVTDTSTYGYLRFSFPTAAQDRTFALFAK
jgi:hypothetical protein